MGHSDYEELIEELKKEIEAWKMASIEDWINFEKKLEKSSKKEKVI